MNFDSCYTGLSVHDELSERTKHTEIREVYDGGKLTGSEIIKQVELGNIIITPFDKKAINPNSYNITLNDTLLVYIDQILDFKEENATRKIIIPEEGYLLQPGTLYLGRTNEYCKTDKFIPEISGRSSIGRLGIEIHATAGFGDIGFAGTWTLEITVAMPVIIYPNIEFGQLSFTTPYGETDILYDGRYQGQIDPTASKSNLTKKVYEV